MALLWFSYTTKPRLVTCQMEVCNCLPPHASLVTLRQSGWCKHDLGDVDVADVLMSEYSLESTLRTCSRFEASGLCDGAAGCCRHYLEEEDVAEVVTAALAAVGLAGFQRRSCHTLSGGERQRLAVAGALAQVPPPLLFLTVQNTTCVNHDRAQ